MEPLTLTLFGGFALKTADNRDVVVAKRKTRALFAYLALKRDQRASRDELIGLLWGDRSEARARHSLSQSLSEIRAATSPFLPHLLRSTREVVSLCSEAVAVDLLHIEMALASAKLQQLAIVVDSFQGVFLGDLLDLEPDYESWRLVRQKEFEETAKEALAQAIEAPNEPANAQNIQKVARRLLDLDPYDERAHRALMRSYAQKDNPRACRKQFDSCCELLKRDLGISPGLETTALYDRLCGQSSDLPSIAVLPFTALAGQANDSIFIAGMTEEIRTALGRFGDLLVYAAESSEIAVGRASSSSSAASMLEVDYHLEGTLSRQENRIRVGVKLLDSRSGKQLWAEHYDPVLDDVFLVQEDIAQRVVGLAVARVKDDRLSRSANKGITNFSAYDCYLRAMQLLTSWAASEEDVRSARALFQKAVDLDAGFAAAHAGLAGCYTEEVRHGWSERSSTAGEKAIALAKKAVSLDGNNSFSRFMLSAAYWHIERNYDLAKAHIETAVALNPNDYKQYCYKAWFSCCYGNLADSISCGEEARKRNPLLPDTCLWVIGVAHYLAGRYEAAISTLNQLSDHDGSVLVLLAASKAKMGSKKEARIAAAKYLESTSNEPLSSEDWFSYWRPLLPAKDDAILRDLVEGIRKAGLAK